MKGTDAMMKWTTYLLAVCLLSMTLLLTLGGCEPKVISSRTANEGAPHVRVRLLAGVSQVVLTSDRSVPVYNAQTGRATSLELTSGRPISLSFDGANWHAGSATLAGETLRIDPDTDGAVAVNGMPYRGAYNLVPAGPGKLDVVNDLDVESYLQGVLAKELLSDWAPEAYRAQAVIARTYALYEARTNPAGRTWDLSPDERSQVYGGMKAETPKSNAAVQATHGIVAAYGPTGQERIFKAYFSSCCGGITSSASDVFNDPAIPPLSAKSNGTTCSISPRFNWPTVVLTKAELTRRFRSWGQKMGRAEANLPGVKTIDIATVNAFGRPRSYLLTDTRGQQYAMTAEQLRWAINNDANGGPTVFSGFFRPVDAGDSIRFADGHGFGHGVGACQWCMQARALAGQNFQQIVTQAYPQAVLVRAF